MAAALRNNAAWLRSIISELLVSPHIHFGHAPAAAMAIRLGPGPIDLFSTRFNNYFTTEVTGIVVGEPVDREGLKKCLLGLQQHYSPDTVTYETPDPGMTAGSNEAQISFTGQSKETGPYKVAIDANEMPTALRNNTAWLQSIISELLVSPYIHFGHAPTAAIAIRLGPGPIDLFSTRFNNYFTTEVTGIVAGEPVDREGLKKCLLGLQQHYSPDTVAFETPDPGTTVGSNEAQISFTGQSKETGPYKVAIDAKILKSGGAKKISSIRMDGIPELFSEKTSSV
ncbi:hypothetical protein M422DRAFT_781217 [Sphaerobolus stellatus SS14]|uniref:Uncharacterized protein n=1 Tax=Sphaerobolus stellatus (strain SS14) TaxID=990650 RepID=A0A0C9VBJ7_SPHS4|nr:hypothetical protein M422DRAFT_781217 [Sphaerobolus stellatus SS14]